MWQTLLENELYIQDNFLPYEMLDEIVTKIDPQKFKTINNKNTPPVMFDTNFDYALLVDAGFRDLPIRHFIFDKMNPLVNEVWKSTLPIGSLHHMQYFFKKNNPTAGVAFDLHAEDIKIYGPVVFMLYLSDETDGQLEIPSIEDAKEDWGKGFQDMIDDFSIRFSPETITLYPKRNRCVVMSTGLAHRVRKCTGLRPNISGWPLFKKDALDTLKGWGDYKGIK
jgi:hypothetical protein